jgi:hypothetical protein
MPELGQDAFHQLFQGAARLGLMCGTLGIPWDQAAAFVAKFPGELDAYLELSVDDSSSELGLMTRGQGQDFTHRVANFMEQRGVGEERLRRLLVTAKHFEHRNLFVKLELNEQGPREISWYFRRRPSLGDAKAWLLQGGAGARDLKLVDQLGQDLGKSTVHFIAQSEPLNGKGFPVSKVYFSQPDNAASWARLRTGAERCGVDWDATLEPHHAGLAARTSFLSVAFGPGLRIPGCKIDVHKLDFGALKKLLVANGRLDSSIPRIRTLLELGGKERMDYVGLRLDGAKPVGVKVYSSLGG